MEIGEKFRIRIMNKRNHWLNCCSIILRMHDEDFGFNVETDSAKTILFVITR